MEKFNQLKFNLGVRYLLPWSRLLRSWWYAKIVAINQWLFDKSNKIIIICFGGGGEEKITKVNINEVLKFVAS